MRRQRLGLVCVCLAALLGCDARDLQAEHRAVHIHPRRLHCSSENAELAELSLLRDPKALSAFISAIPKVFETGTWLQIGANTLDPKGSTYQVDDPLLQYLPLYDKYRKVLVEPVPPLFVKLKQNTLSIPNVHLVNAAIVPDDSTTKTVTMYCPPKEDMEGSWMVGICSMDESVITVHVPGKQAKKYEVEALTVDNLFRSHRVSDVKVVMIDTEGFDVKILKMLPFQDPNFQPDLVVFEHTEISPQEHEEGKEFLHSHCYMLAYDRENTYGLKMIPS